MKRVFGDAFFSAYIDFRERRVELVRTERPFHDLPEILTTSQSLLDTLRRTGVVHSFSLLIDSRAAPCIDQDGYRKKFRKLTARLCDRFEHVAVVVSSDEAVERELPDAPANVDFFTRVEGARRALAHMTGTEHVPRPDEISQRTIVSHGSAQDLHASTPCP